MRPFPKYNGPRTAIADVKPTQITTIAGRIWPGPTLHDASGTIPLHVDHSDLQPGDIVEAIGALTQGTFHADHTRLLVRPTRWRPATAPPAVAIEARDHMNRTTRAFFHNQGFTEVETPNLVLTPGTDVHLEAFQCNFSGMGEARPTSMYLHTSPEFAMKTLLTQGHECIFQICKVYRDGEWTQHHNPEFTMAEWYRAFADQEAVMADVEALVKQIVGPTLRWAETTIDLSLDTPFERLTVQEAFGRHCNDLDILEANTAEQLLEYANAHNLGPLPSNAPWDDLFHQLLVTYVEPKLGLERPTFLTEYPAPLAVLSRRKDDDPRVAERFELYIHGVELCNGFTELNDPEEQRLRFYEDHQRRIATNRASYPMPEGFLKALEAGMPPSGGVALGLDRLLMLTLGADTLGDVLIRAINP